MTSTGELTPKGFTRCRAGTITRTDSSTSRRRFSCSIASPVRRAGRRRTDSSSRRSWTNTSCGFLAWWRSERGTRAIRTRIWTASRTFWVCSTSRRDGAPAFVENSALLLLLAISQYHPQETAYPTCWTGSAHSTKPIAPRSRCARPRHSEDISAGAFGSCITRTPADARRQRRGLSLAPLCGGNIARAVL